MKDEAVSHHGYEMCCLGCNLWCKANQFYLIANVSCCWVDLPISDQLTT
jgi:hypothetical protein